MVSFERFRVVWQRFYRVAGVLALLAAVVAIGVWIGDWRAEQVYRDKADTIYQLRNEISKLENAKLHLERELQLKFAVIENQKDDLLTTRAQIARLQQELVLLDSKHGVEREVGKREMERMKLSSLDAGRQLEQLQSSFKNLTKERDDLRRMLNERRPIYRC
jgi:hypothetical protein